MKGQPFWQRAGYALHGLLAAFRHEPSFRAQLVAGAATLLFTLWLSPSLPWVALMAVMIALVLAAELFNTALEHLLDGLHPGQAEFVRIAKDCSAAAVLVFSVAAVVVFALMLADTPGHRGWPF